MLNIPNDIELQHTWVNSEYLPEMFTTFEDMLQELLTKDLILPALSYTKYMPLQVKDTFSRPEIAIEAIPIPDGTVYFQANQRVILMKGESIQSGHELLNGAMALQDPEQPPDPEDILTIPLNNAYVLFMGMRATLPLSALSSYTNVLVVEGQVKLIYHHPQPAQIVRKHLQYMDAQPFIAAAKASLPIDLVRAVLKALDSTAQPNPT